MLQAIAAASGETARSEQETRGMDDQASYLARAGADLSDEQELVDRVDGSPDPLRAEVAQLSFEFGDMAGVLLDQRVQLIELDRADAHLALGDFVPQPGRAFTQAHPPRQDSVLVHALRNLALTCQSSQCTLYSVMQT